MFLILPRGVQAKVEEMLLRFECRLEIKDRRAFHPDAGFKLGSRSVLRAYQERAVERLWETKGGVVRGPCGSGKTVVLIAAIARFDQPAIVIVSTKSLAQQWRGALNAWLGFQPGSIESGQRNIRPVTVATQQSTWSMLNKGEGRVFEQFGMLIGDEIHHWAARTFLEVSTAFPAAYRIGASADERRKDGLEHLIYETFGELVCEIKKEELIEVGHRLPSRMEIVPTRYEDTVYTQSLRAKESPDWTGMITRLCEDDLRREEIFFHLRRAITLKNDNEDNRTTIISDQGIIDHDQTNTVHNAQLKRLPPTGKEINAHFALNKNRVLLLSERVESCRWWVQRLRAAGIPAGLMIGGPANKQELEDTISGLRFGSLRVGVGTKVADEGLDIPALTHVFVTCPVHKNPKRLEQMIGRAARCHEGKKEAVCIYFWDRALFPYRDPTDTERGHQTKEDNFLRSLGRAVDRWEVIHWQA